MRYKVPRGRDEHFFHARGFSLLKPFNGIDKIDFNDVILFYDEVVNNLFIRRHNFPMVAAKAEGAALKIGACPLELYFDKLPHKLFSIKNIPYFEV